jgi:predicted AlkP superfamily pyrophosphatase or phosphodiesterase
MKEHSLGADESPDILAIGFSATDVIGHTYGPDSQELMDQLLRLDALLEQLFQHIEKEVGLSNTLVVMTADHGVMPLAEILKSRGIEAVRIRPTTLEIPVIQALQAQKLNPYEIISHFEPPDFYLNREAIQRSEAKLETVEAVIKKTLKETGFVEAVFTSSDLMNENHSNTPAFKLLQNSFFAPRSADIIVVTKPYVYIEDYLGGTGHGTLHDYDRHVPIVFMGPGIFAGNYPDQCGPEDIVPTLGWLLGISVQAEKDSRVLTEILETKRTIVKKR